MTEVSIARGTARRTVGRVYLHDGTRAATDVGVTSPVPLDGSSSSQRGITNEAATCALLATQSISSAARRKTSFHRLGNQAFPRSSTSHDRPKQPLAWGTDPPVSRSCTRAQIPPSTMPSGSAAAFGFNRWHKDAEYTVSTRPREVMRTSAGTVRSRGRKNHPMKPIPSGVLSLAMLDCNHHVIRRHPS